MPHNDHSPANDDEPTLPSVDGPIPAPVEPSRSEPAPTCRLIRSDDAYEGKQGFRYFAGVSAESAGAQGLCMHVLRLPPGARAHAHLHEHHESAAYVVQGTVGMWYGERLENHMIVREGEFSYIPAGVPHLPYNAGPGEAIGIIARTDPKEQESVLLLPELDGIHP
jgi:uncharacterized RmlC-like cupin family protein